LETKLSNSEFEIIAWLRLGVELRIPDNAKCSCKRNAPLGRHAQHIFVCNTANAITYRHNSLQRAIFQLATYCNPKRVVSEPYNMFRTISEKNIQGDILIQNLSKYASQPGSKVGSRDILLDVSVTYPCC